MSLKGAQYEKAEAVEQVVRNGVEKLRTIPGVVNASATCCVPLQGGYGLPFRIVGRPLAADSQGPFHGGGGWMTVSPGYFEVFKIPVKRGRTFNERDTSTSTPVVVINEAMAKQYWPKADPLTDRLVIGKGVMREFASEGERQIIGVVGGHQEQRARQRAAAADVHSAGAGARRGQRAEREPDADFLDRADAGAAAVAEQRDPGSAAPVDGAAGVRREVDGRDRRRCPCRARSSTCG